MPAPPCILRSAFHNPSGPFPEFQADSQPRELPQVGGEIETRLTGRAERLRKGGKSELRPRASLVTHLADSFVSGPTSIPGPASPHPIVSSARRPRLLGGLDPAPLGPARAGTAGARLRLLPSNLTPPPSRGSAPPWRNPGCWHEGPSPDSLGESSTRPRAASGLRLRFHVVSRPRLLGTGSASKPALTLIFFFFLFFAAD